MKFDKQTIVAVTLCVIAYIGYEIHLNKKYPKRYERKEYLTENTDKKNEAKTPKDELKPPSTKPTNKKVKQKIKLLSEEELTIDTRTTTYKFDQKTGGLIVTSYRPLSN